MISAEQRAALVVACDQLEIAKPKFDDIVRVWGGHSEVSDLDGQQYTRVLDYLVVKGFRDTKYVEIVGRDYTSAFYGLARQLIAPACREQIVLALHNAAGCPGQDLFHSWQFTALLRGLLPFGLTDDMVRAALARQVMTKKQLALLHLAKREIGMSDELYAKLLEGVAGVITGSADLDQVGFRRILVAMEVGGFVAPGRRAKPAKRETFGRRPGMASQPQIQLIRDMWGEWSGSDDQAELSAWLERFHHVSSLRFLTAAKAAAVITALKAMKRRPKVSAAT